jgi:hypothetical protein
VAQQRPLLIDEENERSFILAAQRVIASEQPAAAGRGVAGGGTTQALISAQANVIAAAVADDAAAVADDAGDQRMVAIRLRIERANENREQYEAQQASLRPYLDEMRQMAHGFQSLTAPRDAGFLQNANAAFRSGLTPFIELLRHALEPSTIRKMREMSLDQFRTHGIVFRSDEEKNRFIECYEQLLLEAIQQNISIPIGSVSIAIDLIWNNNLFRIGASLVGTYFSIIIASDSLILFADTIIGAITVGTITASELTVLCGNAYHNCTWVNFGNMLVRLGVDPNNVVNYIQAIQDYTAIQLQYITMTVYIMCLQRCSASIGIARDELQNLFNRMNLADNPPPGLGDPPNAAAQLMAQPQPQPQAQPLLNLYGNVVGIARAIKEILALLWNNGIRFTASCVMKLFTLFAAAVPDNQSLQATIIREFGNFALFVAGITLQRAQYLSPADRPNDRALKLMFRLINLDLTDAREENFLYALHAFSNNTLIRMRIILENHILNPRIEIRYNTLTRDCLDTLSQFFQIRRGDENPPEVDLGKFQTISGLAPLLSSPLTSQNLGLPPRPDQPGFDSMDAVAGEQAPPQYARDYENPGGIASRTTNGMEYVSGMLDLSTEELGVVLSRAGQPLANARLIARRQAFKNAIMAHCMTMVDGFTRYMDALVVGRVLSQEECNRIKPVCIPTIQALQDRIMSGEFDRLIDYIISQNPRDAIPIDIITACRNVTQATAAAAAAAARTAAAAAGAAAAAAGAAGAAAAAATTNAVASWGASLFGLVRRGAGAALNNSIRALACILPAPNAPAAPPAAAAAAGNAAALAAAPAAIDQQIERIVAGQNAPEPIPDAAAELANAPNNIALDMIYGMNNVAAAAAAAPEQVAQGGVMPQGGNIDLDGGRSRSRKRSASKRTRRKAKQSSKKLKRKSRRYVRRRRSIRRKN